MADGSSNSGIASNTGSGCTCVGVFGRAGGGWTARGAGRCASTFGRGFGGPSAGNVLGGAVGQELGQTSSELIRRGMNVAPTIEVRPGYAFNVMVIQDLVFPGPYDDTVRP